jgi:DNA-directed RNA polymerase subunit RPC12/RpoP
MEGKVLLARCVNCRSEVTVPERYAHGDHIKCGTCGTQHKVLRGDVLRLVIADVAPLKEALRDTEVRIERLEDELRGARASMGIGVNGLAVGVVYAIYQVGVHGTTPSGELLIKSIAIALVVGFLLEFTNYLFLAKRRRMTQLTEEIEVLSDEARQLDQKIREASRR